MKKEVLLIVSLIAIFICGCSIDKSANHTPVNNLEKNELVLENFVKFSLESDLKYRVYGLGEALAEIVTLHNKTLTKALKFRYTPKYYSEDRFIPFLSVHFPTLTQLSNWSAYSHLNFFFNTSTNNMLLVLHLFDCSKQGQGRWRYGIPLSNWETHRFGLISVPLDRSWFQFAPPPKENVSGKGKIMSFEQLCGLEFLVKVYAENVTETLEFGKFYLNK